MKYSTLNKSLVGHWQLDAQNGATDLTPNNRNGTAVNGAVIGGATDRHGQANRASAFTNAANSYVSIPDISFANNLPWTISFWANPTVLSDYRGFCGDDSPTAGHYSRLFLGDSGKIYFYTTENKETNWVSAITTGWQLITLTCTGTAPYSAELFVNGVSKTLKNITNATTSAIIINKIGNLTGSSTAYSLDGSMADFRVYNRVLTQTEITQLYDTYRPKLRLFGDDEYMHSVGYIRVDKTENNKEYFDNPTSTLYGKTHFYVMKWQARNNGGIPQSTGTGLPWVSISQLNAKSASLLIGDGYHLMTNDEWMAIARDIESVSSNYVSGVLKRGNVGNTDTGNYDGANPEAGVTNALATLTLSNGETINHLSGNVWEWVDYTIAGAGSQPKDNDDATWAWNEFSAIDTWGNVLGYDNVGPKNHSLDGSTGAGRIYSANDNTYATLRALIRGGYWVSTSYAGVFTLLSNNGPTAFDTSVGFRCAR